ncbi:hypothetical protein RhiLY_06082 [Ceratobasidium sp. AG-Ba]|nr:hypothetical protein RhiLY_06082 [Ceratobasidium sp. AG-Ba]
MSAYASPPRSARASTPKSPKQSHASTSKAAIDSSLQALSQPPPPTLREILAAYASKGQGDRDMLIALLNAKAAEESRIAAVAALQQNVLQAQLGIAAAQIRQRQSPPPKSPVSPTSPLSPVCREVSPSVRARKEARAHPYARPLKSEPLDWGTPRKSWDAVSDERSTSEE